VTAIPVFTSVELSELDKAFQGRSFAARRDAAIIAVFTATGIFSRGAKRTCGVFSRFGCSWRWLACADGTTGVVERPARRSPGWMTESAWCVSAGVRWR
jgi:hypothetical protein